MPFVFTASEVAEELTSTMEKALGKIADWKAHILRTQNQEEGRYKALEELQTHQLFIVMDWAMKFLPAFYREKQSDFFGQKGMSWHVSVAIFRAEDGSLKVFGLARHYLFHLYFYFGTSQVQCILSQWILYFKEDTLR